MKRTPIQKLSGLTRTLGAGLVLVTVANIVWDAANAIYDISNDISDHIVNTSIETDIAKMRLNQAQKEVK